MEEWKAISINPNYEVSTYGNIRRTSTKRCLYIEKTKVGYCRVRLRLGLQGMHDRFNVHRLVAEAFIPNPNDYPCVNHIDGNKTNNHIENLEWCSYAHNNKHAYDTGLKTPYQQRIKEKDFGRIEQLKANGMSVAKIAELYGVTPSAIYQLHYRRKIKLHS